MRTRSNIFYKAIVLMLLAVLTLALRNPAVAITNSTTLITSVPTDISLKLEILGNGTVSVNMENYTQSGTITLPRNAEVLLDIQPKHGNYISSVVYNGSDMTENAKGGKLYLPSTNRNATLRVVFSEIVTVPATGDRNYYAVITCTILMSVSFAGIILVSVLKRRKQVN